MSPERPDISRYQAEMGKPTRLGEALTIVGHPFAQPVTNQDLLRLAIDQGLPQAQIEAGKAAIAATGFTNRYLSYFPDQKLNLEKAIDRTVG